MRIFEQRQALTAAAALAVALALLSGCSSGTVTAPIPSTQHGHMHSLMGRLNSGVHFKSFDSCPASKSY
jgi:hypothetical protein